MESESPLDVLSRAATMLHREETVTESPYAVATTNRSRALSLRCSAMEGTVGTVGKWKRERRHRAVWKSPPRHFRNCQEPLDMTTTNAGGSARTLPKEQRASVIMASPVTGHNNRPPSATTGGMSDPVIDEHFRRSLGKDYINVFAPTVTQREPREQQRQRQQQQQTDGGDAGLSAVDDHFAKALGDTWIKLQKEEYQKKKKDATTSSSSGGSGSNATMATTAAAADGGRQKVNVYGA